ncbi:MAG: hypothetical protein QM802_01255 [Agriterribacter sp.]
MKKVILMAGNYTISTTEELKQSGYSLIFAASVEEAIEKFQQTDVDVIVLHHELNTADKNKLIAVVRFQDEYVEIINPAKEASLTTILEEAIKEQANKQKAYFTIQDDALKYAGYNIHVENPDHNN